MFYIKHRATIDIKISILFKDSKTFVYIAMWRTRTRENYSILVEIFNFPEYSHHGSDGSGLLGGSPEYSHHGSDESGLLGVSPEYSHHSSDESGFANRKT